jgi:uncharacterized membrane protein
VGNNLGNTAAGGVAGGAAAGLAGLAITGALTGPVGWVALAGAVVGALAGHIITSVSGGSNDEEALALEKLAHEYETNGNARFASDSEFKKLLSELNITDKKLVDSLTENRTATLDLAKEMALAN